MSRASNLAGFTTSISPPSSLSVGIVTATSVQTTSINGGPLAGFRNAIINGNFDFWQRGTSFTASAYGADRWISVRSGTTHTVTRQTFTLGQTAVPGEPTYFCRTVVSSVAGAGNFSILVQKIEGVRAFAGQQVTISFWAKADATKNIAVELAQLFGSGGSPSTDVTAIGVSKVSIGTTFQKVTVTATVPSISGKTLGTNNDDNFALLIWFDAGSTYNARTDTLGQQSGTFEIAQVQLEAGPVATPFELRPIGTELALCQRYFQTNACSQGAMNESNDRFVTPLGFKHPMRAVPNISIFVATSGIHRPGIAFLNITSMTEASTEAYLTLTISSNFGPNISGQLMPGAIAYSAEL